jgi:hypothetical protein
MTSQKNNVAKDNAALEKSLNRLTLDSDTAMFLMEVEDMLRSSGKEGLANDLDKLQKDITGWYAYADTPDPVQGKLVKPFIDNYEDVTPKRINALLDAIHGNLTGNLQERFAALSKEASIPVQQAAYTRPSKKGPSCP